MTDSSSDPSDERDWSLFDELAADQLESEDEAARAQSDKKLEAESAAALERMRQTNDMRDRLFTTIQRVLVVTLVAAAALMACYIVSEWGELDPVVFVSFNAAVVVNTIGLAYVVAKNLFPPDEQKPTS